MIESLLSTILKNTFSQTQLKHNLLILRSFILQKIFGSQKPTLFTPADLNWLGSLDANFYQQFTSENAYKTLAQLETYAGQITPLVIYLPFQADENTTSQICIFARQTFQKPAFLLDVKFNPLLIAGCSLSWQGIYKDYSLRKKIEERKEDLMESFKKFLQ